jgi:hypothetical protein
MNDNFDREARDLTTKFEMGNISGFEFDKRFRELEEMYFPKEQNRKETNPSK